MRERMGEGGAEGEGSEWRRDKETGVDGLVTRKKGRKKMFISEREAKGGKCRVDK